EAGDVPGGPFRFVSGPPAALNERMERGELDVSSASSVEYATRPERYLLVPDLAIGSRGPVQSVLLLARRPVQDLDGREVLVSAQTHTSAALLHVLFTRRYRIRTAYRTGDATAELTAGQRPEAILCIGDEALLLRRHPDYPVTLDLGEAWRQWTGLPFIFGVWIVRREAWERQPERMAAACRALLAGKAAGQASMAAICDLAAQQTGMGHEEVCSYFRGLAYDLGPEEQSGLRLFFRHLAAVGRIPAVPDLAFAPLEDVAAPTVPTRRAG
ncbi:MAG: menaquinone biosynthetic enzyme MqnA/MqnD family protein, partial [Desulfovibrionaceae bacterium]